MVEKVVVIFIEGETEVEFYNEYVRTIRKYCGDRLGCKVEIENAKSICRFKNKILSVFKKKIKPKYSSDTKFYIALCYDQDVFELSQNPPVDWRQLKEMFLNNGAEEVCLVKAINSIEDWFLYDKAGVLNFLKLPSDTKVVGNSGAEKLKYLFKKKNKLYVKGKQSANFVKALDIEKILSQICSSMKPLCKMLGVECHKKQFFHCKKK